MWDNMVSRGQGGMATKPMQMGQKPQIADQALPMRQAFSRPQFGGGDMGAMTGAFRGGAPQMNPQAQSGPMGSAVSGPMQHGAPDLSGLQAAMGGYQPNARDVAQRMMAARMLGARGPQTMPGMGPTITPQYGTFA